MHIEDIQKITRKEADRFPEYLSTHMDAISKSATQVLYRVRKQLFLSARVRTFPLTCGFWSVSPWKRQE